MPDWWGAAYRCPVQGCRGVVTTPYGLCRACYVNTLYRAVRSLSASYRLHPRRLRRS